MNIKKKKIENIYWRYNRKEYVHPDPLEFLYNYKDRLNIEIVGFISACFAYGSVNQILRNLNFVLTILTTNPYEYIKECSYSELQNKFKNFKYRFTKEEDIISLILGLKQIIFEYGSLKNCFFYFYSNNDENYITALSGLRKAILENYNIRNSHLLPDPGKNSACKRLMLFMRWMVRSDAVDPGTWNELPNEKLIIPLDIHMYNIAKTFELTKRKSPDLKTAKEITEKFKELNRKDPCKYDFSLTRFGINESLNYKSLVEVLNE